MNGAKHRFALGLTCFSDRHHGCDPFLLYTPNAFVTRWREWYIETAMGTMTHQWLAHLVHPGEHHQRGDDQALPDEPEAGGHRQQLGRRMGGGRGGHRQKHRRTNSMPCSVRLDESEFERFLADNPEYLENGYDEINIDLIGEPEPDTLRHRPQD